MRSNILTVKRAQADEKRCYVKRIIGLGGDTVEVKDSKVYVNGEELNGVLGSGKYVANYPVEGCGPVTVLRGEYFLVGDNLANRF